MKSLLKEVFRVTSFVLTILVLSVETIAQTGINTPTPNDNAVLDIVSSSKGILIPRLNLTTTTSPSPVATHVRGMMVFNLAKINDVEPGLYLNSGTEWLKLTTNVPQLVAHARNTSTQIINHGAPRAKVEFNTLVKSNGNFNLAAENYTVTKAGYYRVETILGVTPSTISNSQIFQISMGSATDVTFWSLSNTPASLFVRTASICRHLNAGDTITLYFQPCVGSCTANYNLSNAEIIITRVGE